MLSRAPSTSGECLIIKKLWALKAKQRCLWQHKITTACTMKLWKTSRSLEQRCSFPLQHHANRKNLSSWQDALKFNESLNLFEITWTHNAKPGRATTPLIFFIISCCGQTPARTNYHIHNQSILVLGKTMMNLVLLQHFLNWSFPSFSSTAQRHPKTQLFLQTAQERLLLSAIS